MKPELEDWGDPDQEQTQPDPFARLWPHYHVVSEAGHYEVTCLYGGCKFAVTLLGRGEGWIDVLIDHARTHDKPKA